MIPIDLTVRLYLAKSGMQILLDDRSWCFFSKWVDKLIHKHAHLLHLATAVCLLTFIQRDLRLRILALVLLNGVGNFVWLGTLIL